MQSISLYLTCIVTTMLTATPPETPKHPVTDTYHGVAVRDDYRWLEDWDQKSVKAWSDSQNAHARAYLDHLPNVAAIRARVTEIMAAKTVGYWDLEVRHGTVFAMKRQPPKQQPFLIVIPAFQTSQDARVLVDPNEMDKAGTTAIDWYIPSPDGKTVAVSISAGGSESGDIHFFDTATGKKSTRSFRE